MVSVYAVTAKGQFISFLGGFDGRRLPTGQMCVCLWGFFFLKKNPPPLSSYRLGIRFHRPQTKFTKVMFSQVSVCPRGCLPHCMLGYTPRPEADTPPPGADPPGTRGRHPPPREQTPPGPEADPSGSRHPPPPKVHAGRYGQQASSTHPTGMHTCSLSFSLCFLPGTKICHYHPQTKFWAR